MRVRVRPPAAAGRFYPADPALLEAEIGRMLDQAGHRPGPAPAAMLLPHAGYRYSGVVAAAGYRRMADSGASFRRVAVLCPNHTVPLTGMAVSAADRWSTPAGEVDVDDALRETAAGLNGVAIDDAPHRHEHAVEVHLPFLMRVLDEGWTLLPVVVGAIATSEGAAVVGALADAGALVIVSTDLSHYLPHDQARRRDDATLRAIVMRDTAAIGGYDACGRYAIQALLASNAVNGMDPEVLDARTSADTAGERDRTVGYASVAWA